MKQVQKAKAVILLYTQNKRSRGAAIFCVDGSSETLIEITSKLCLQRDFEKQKGYCQLQVIQTQKVRFPKHLKRR